MTRRTLGKLASGLGSGGLAFQVFKTRIQIGQVPVAQQIEKLDLGQTQELGGLTRGDLALLKELKENPFPGLPPQLRLRNVESRNQLFGKLDRLSARLYPCSTRSSHP